MFSLPIHRLKFDGAILERGFWIYVWKISFGSKVVVYIGRTGDSSSPNASSPFRRMGQHLDLKAGAKGNSLKRAINQEGWEPQHCHFEHIAIGPLFPEQDSMGTHIPYRDRTAAIEFALSQVIEKAYRLIGTHGSSFAVLPEDEALKERLVAEILAFLRRE
jgi:hypothetical protein